MQRTVVLPDGRSLSYELERKRVKNINFRPKSDGVIYVSANSRATITEIERFIVSRADFFFKAFEKYRARELREENTDELPRSVMWLGRALPVRVIKSSGENAALFEDECCVFTRRGDDIGYVRSLITRAVNTRFAALIGELDAEVRQSLAERGLAPPPIQIRIKDISSRWGSCTPSNGHITMNVRLAAYPRETVLGVLWHEYSHLWHLDHSKKFYAFLLDKYPDYYKWHKLLKRDSADNDDL